MDELRRRLSRLGGASGQTLTPRPRAVAQPIEQLVQGSIYDTEHGPSFRVVRVYTPDTRHGSCQLADWLTQTPETITRVGADDLLRRADMRRFVFLDTETTGLGPGTGNFAFIVGIGFFNDQDQFEVHQFFLRNPDEELAMLALLHQAVSPDGGLVTFNGRSFDVPLLADRFVMSRMRSHVNRLPNLDLLHPARKLWKRRLASCRLSALEVDILGLQRTHEDVPGHLIPYLYREYLKNGDAREMVRVLYHNEQDILSMVALAVMLCRAFERPEAPAMPIEDRISLARWYHQRGMLNECETAYRAALDEAPDEATRYDALTGLGAMLKRTGRSAEAVPLWEYVADLRLDISGHEELAKYYEWQAANPQQALAWTEAGIVLAESWRPGLRRTEAIRALEGRQARLLRKVETRR
jgi:uncharacterized protein YprB with RNaseH-like and TPR domain